MSKSFTPFKLCRLLRFSKTKAASAISATNSTVPSDATTMTTVDESFFAVFRSLKLDVFAKVVISVKRRIEQLMPDYVLLGFLGRIALDFNNRNSPNDYARVKDHRRQVILLFIQILNQLI